MSENSEKVVLVLPNGGSVTARDGMTVGTALKELGIKLRWGARLSVNGDEADESTPVKGGDKIVITPRIRNGAV